MTAACQDVAAEHQETMRTVATMILELPEAAKCVEDIPGALFQDAGATRPGTNEEGQ